MFSARGKNSLVTPNFPEQDGEKPSFFYALSKLPFAVIMKRFFDFYHSELMVWAVREPPYFYKILVGS
jgi:hypothetical protein